MMEEALREPNRRVVGAKQALRALKEGKAAHVFLCKDADDFLYRKVEAACEEANVPVTKMDSMAQLGKLCRVEVKTAAAAILK